MPIHITRWAESVSYTHLDVYKRQEAAPALYVQRLPIEVDSKMLAIAAHFVETQDAIAFVEERDGNRIGAILCDTRPSAFPPSGLGNVGPVSYTHLDVYKRQAHPWMRASIRECWSARTASTSAALLSKCW